MPCFIEQILAFYMVLVADDYLVALYLLLA